jgi:hypothetical protein
MTQPRILFDSFDNASWTVRLENSEPHTHHILYPLSLINDSDQIPFFHFNAPEWRSINPTTKDKCTDVMTDFNTLHQGAEDFLTLRSNLHQDGAAYKVTDEYVPLTAESDQLVIWLYFVHCYKTLVSRKIDPTKDNRFRRGSANSAIIKNIT